MLTVEHVRDICLIGHGTDECRYLSSNPSGELYCSKKARLHKQAMDERIDKYIKECKAKGISIIAEDVPLGDNCSGYLNLPGIEQGYNKP